MDLAKYKNMQIFYYYFISIIIYLNSLFYLCLSMCTGGFKFPGHTCIFWILDQEIGFQTIYDVTNRACRPDYYRHDQTFNEHRQNLFFQSWMWQTALQSQTLHIQHSARWCSNIQLQEGKHERLLHFPLHSVSTQTHLRG